jgi:hypothetical protein
VVVVCAQRHATFTECVDKKIKLLLGDRDTPLTVIATQHNTRGKKDSPDWRLLPANTKTDHALIRINSLWPVEEFVLWEKTL